MYSFGFFKTKKRFPLSFMICVVLFFPAPVLPNRTSYPFMYFAVALTLLQNAGIFECQTKIRIRCLLKLNLYFDCRKIFENFLIWMVQHKNAV